MFIQIGVCMTIGLAGMAYLIGYERVVMVRFLQNTGPYLFVLQAKRWANQRDSVFTVLWPGVEEAIVRGIPMLLAPNHALLVAVLLLLNVGFALGHPDTDVIGSRRTLLRFATGLVFMTPAAWLYNLYACYLLHASWNLSVVIRRWNHDGRDRIIIWTEGPIEILTEPGAQPSRAIRRIFRNTRSVMTDPRA